MGLFDLHCAASGLALDDRARLVFLLDGEPLLPPLLGGYDRYGKIEEIVSGPELWAAEALAKRTKRDLEGLIEEAFDAGVSVGKATLRYSLVDDAIYRAIVGTAAATGGSSTVKLPKLGEELVAPWKKDERMKHALEQLGLFLGAEHGTLEALSPDSPGGQYTSLKEVRPLIRAAEQRFAGKPLVLAAVAENERAWRERGS